MAYFSVSVIYRIFFPQVRYNELFRFVYLPGLVFGLLLFVIADDWFKMIPVAIPLAAILGFIVYYLRNTVFWFAIATLLLAGVAYIAYPNYTAYLSGTCSREKDTRIFLPLVNSANDTVNLAASKGKVSALYFWSRSCVVCEKKLPDWDKLAMEFSNDGNVNFSSVYIPIKDNIPQRSFNKLKKYSFNKLYAIEPDKWQIPFFPKVLIYDKNGILRYSGELHTEPYVLFNNARYIIRDLQKEK
ncbi:MAG: TlpA family protein disulfide reductase [Flavipsychrobacter sp.]